MRRVADLKIANSVRFMGFVREAIPWMQRLDLFLFFSEHEAAPVAVIEAMTYATPTVAGDIPGTREILADAGLLVPLHDTDQLAKSILALFSDKKNPRRLSQKRCCPKPGCLFGGQDL